MYLGVDGARRLIVSGGKTVKFGFRNNKFCAKLTDGTILYMLYDNKYITNTSIPANAANFTPPLSTTEPSYNSDTVSTGGGSFAVRFPGGPTSDPNKYLFLNINSLNYIYFVPYGIAALPWMYTWYTET